MPVELPVLTWIDLCVPSSSVIQKKKNKLTRIATYSVCHLIGCVICWIDRVCVFVCVLCCGRNSINESTYSFQSIYDFPPKAPIRSHDNSNSTTTVPLSITQWADSVVQEAHVHLWPQECSVWLGLGPLCLHCVCCLHCRRQGEWWRARAWLVVRCWVGVGRRIYIHSHVCTEIALPTARWVSNMYVCILDLLKSAGW